MVNGQLFLIVKVLAMVLEAKMKCAITIKACFIVKVRMDVTWVNEVVKYTILLLDSECFGFIRWV